MDMSIRDHIRKRREEDDDDLMILIIPALHHLGYLGGRDAEPQHTSLLTRVEKVRELLEGPVKKCRIAFRMEPYIFKALANYLGKEKLVRDTRIKVEEKLGFFLYMLSHNASYGDLQVFFGHSNGTFHNVMKFFDIVVPALNLRFLKAPSNQVHPKIHGDNRFYPYFKNFLGAIDGTHIPISEGSADDARVLRSTMNTPVGKFQVPPGKFYLVDGGYANTASFLAPYRKVRYHLKEFGHGHRRPQNYKELFNHRHAVLWNHDERALGVLKKRFQILKVATFHKLENQVKIPLAAAVLYNIIRSMNRDEKWLDNQPNNIDPIHFVNLPDGDQGYYEANIEGNNLRDSIVHAMWADYQHRRN
ncbi:hypothetical protein ACQ4PT_054122 [Festuca glaucescens]